MKYFFTEEERKRMHTSCCFEFQKGEFDGVHFKDTSLYMSDEIFDELHLFELFTNALGSFNYYGVTRVTAEDWDKIRSSVRDERINDVISELSEWAEECFKSKNVFYILGI